MFFSDLLLLLCGDRFCTLHLLSFPSFRGSPMKDTALPLFAGLCLMFSCLGSDDEGENSVSMSSKSLTGVTCSTCSFSGSIEITGDKAKASISSDNGQTFGPQEITVPSECKGQAKKLTGQFAMLMMQAMQACGCTANTTGTTDTSTTDTTKLTEDPCIKALSGGITTTTTPTPAATDTTNTGSQLPTNSNSTLPGSNTTTDTPASTLPTSNATTSCAAYTNDPTKNAECYTCVFLGKPYTGTPCLTTSSTGQDNDTSSGFGDDDNTATDDSDLDTGTTTTPTTGTQPNTSGSSSSQCMTYADQQQYVAYGDCLSCYYRGVSYNGARCE